MNNYNVLSEIAAFLDLRSFRQFSAVNKLFNLVSKNDLLWETHFFESFFGDLTMFGDIQKIKGSIVKNKKNSCQQLCKSFGELKALWRQMGRTSEESEDFKQLQNDFFLTLKEPFLPVPVVRKDGFYFETIFQDLIGNYESDRENGEFQSFSSAFNGLEKIKVSLGSYFADSAELQKLTVSRWLFKGIKEEEETHGSMTSQSASGEIEAENILIELADRFKKTIKLHCKAVSLHIGSIVDSFSFISAYVAYWEAFCSSMHQIESLFYSMNTALNKAYDQKFKLSLRSPVYSSSRVMAITWRRCIFPTHGARLVQFLITEIGKIRTGHLTNSPYEPDLIILKKAVDSIIDLSVHELSVRYTQHSQFESTGLLAELKEAIISSTQNYYISLHVKVHILNKLLADDLDLITQIFIPSISKPLKELNVNTRLKAISEHYLNLFQSFPDNNEDPPVCSLSNTRLALFLFTANPSRSSKLKLHHFLSYFSDKQERNLISDYNSLIEDVESPCYKDAEIDYANRKSKKPTADELKLFSLSADLRYDDFLVILNNFNLM